MTKTLIAGLGSIGRRHLRNLVACGETDIVLLRSHRATLPEEDLAGYPVETDLKEAIAQAPAGGCDRRQPNGIAPGCRHPGGEDRLCHPVGEAHFGFDARVWIRLQAAIAEERRTHPRGIPVPLSSEPVMRPAVDSGWPDRPPYFRLQVHFGEYLPAWHPWEDYRKGYAARADLGGGVVLTQCHSLDYLPWLVGPVEAAWGMAAKLSDLEVDVDDTAEIGLAFRERRIRQPASGL